jgi:cytochrome bd-type quinol oxidase subunit 1
VETERGAPLVLFAVPTEELRRIDYAVEFPKLASAVLT